MDALEKLGWEKKENNNKIEYVFEHEIVIGQVEQERIVICRDGHIYISDTCGCADFREEELLALAEIVKEE